jgi:tetratricopeptide (TPR) repeat protein
MPPRSRLELVWRADNPDARPPAVLPPRAPRHMVAFHHAYMCGSGGDFAKAIDLFRKVVGLKPDFVEAHFDLGWTLRKVGKDKEAIAAFREAIRRKPDFAEAYVNLGSALHDNGPDAVAEIALYLEAIRWKPDSEIAYANLGAALIETGEFSKAIVACRTAIELQPDWLDAYYNLGIALKADGQIQEAIETYRNAIKIDPNFAPALYNLGVALDRQGHRDEAIAAYREAVRVTPDWAEALFNLGELLALSGQIPEAIDAFDKSLKTARTEELRQQIASEIDNLIDPSKKNRPVETNTEVYTGVAMPTTAQKMDLLADDLNVPPENRSEFQRMVFDAARAVTARPETAPAASPEPAPAPAWPDKKWKDAPEKVFGKKLGIVTFLKREWEPFIQRSGQVVTRDILAMHDPDAEEALSRHLERHEFPKGISIIYPKYLAKIASERPELVRAAFGIADLRS